MRYYLSAKIGGRTYYNCGPAEWMQLFPLRRFFDSIHHARQTREASIFRESILIHTEEDDAQEEQAQTP